MLHVPLESNYWLSYCCCRSLAFGELCLLGYQIMTLPYRKQSYSPAISTSVKNRTQTAVTIKHAWWNNVCCKKIRYSRLDVSYVTTYTFIIKWQLNRLQSNLNISKEPGTSYTGERKITSSYPGGSSSIVHSPHIPVITRWPYYLGGRRAGFHCIPKPYLDLYLRSLIVIYWRASSSHSYCSLTRIF